jgi:ankyrin repeat protein
MNQADQQLLQAASEGNLSEVIRLLEMGANVNAREQVGDTALNQAARYGHLEVVKRLLEAGADIENKGGADLTPLMNAALVQRPSAGHFAIVQLLLERGARVSQDLLSSVQLRVNILEENAEAGMVTPDAVAGWNWFLKFLQLAQIKQTRPRMEHLSESDSQLLRAADEGKLDDLAAAIRVGANVNASDDQDISALRWAAQGGHVEAVKILLEAGADVNRKSRLGWTALMQAVIAGSVETVSELIERGADVKADATALFFARDIVQFSPDKEAAGEIIKLLETHGAEESPSQENEG